MLFEHELPETNEWPRFYAMIKNYQRKNQNETYGIEFGDHLVIKNGYVVREYFKRIINNNHEVVFEMTTYTNI